MYAAPESPNWSELSPGLSRMRGLQLDGGGDGPAPGLSKVDQERVYRESRLRDAAKMRMRCDSLNRSRVASDEDMYRARKSSRDMLAPGRNGQVPSRGDFPNPTWAEASRVRN